MRIHKRQVALLCHVRKTLRSTVTESLETVLLSLLQKFPAFYDHILDIYLIVKEKRLGVHKQALREAKYETEASKENPKIKKQQDIIARLKQNQ